MGVQPTRFDPETTKFKVRKRQKARDWGKPNT